MRIAYLDCFSGISGDMFLGALLDAGVPAALLHRTVAALKIGARLEISRVNRSGIAATKVDVLVDGEKELPRELYWQRHDQDHAHQHAHSDAHGRSLTEIKRIIATAAISPQARALAISIFEALGRAEAKIHNVEIETIHFHELGALDSMVDIVCAAAGVEALAVDEWVSSPLNVGGGTVQCAHGTFPVPAPATVELLAGAPVYSSGLSVELVTPTGAAIAKTMVKRFAAFPRMSILRAGYGAGTRDLPGHANVLRLTLGEGEQKARTRQETISVLEANLDDLNPQVFGYVLDHLLTQGALEVFGMPVQMKKNRPGMLLTVLCRPEDSSRLSQIMFRETTTLGVRHREEGREALARRWVTVETRWGSVRMKVAGINGATSYAPEYEDCRRIAAEHRVPLKTVMQEATQQYLTRTQSMGEDTEGSSEPGPTLP
ncbi:MAG: nickel pincer cofactor biosynthesis protein LarC [Acidobacteria bacterium]|nr:nickel pincer cofactor biosynthesis protein LarC [Acidobacteriota bacterium]MBV9479255.1 nickel pincer cofactor biosynthesis protein LarC [Acidobacteriota bacterium]